MYWNHRIVRRTLESGDVVYGVHEAYYDDNDKVAMITAEPVRLDSETLNDLKRTWAMLMEAFAAPVLDFDQIPEEGYDESEDSLVRSLNYTDEDLAEMEARDAEEVFEELLPGWTPKEEGEWEKEQAERRVAEESEHIEKYVGASPDAILRLITELRSQSV